MTTSTTKIDIDTRVTCYNARTGKLLRGVVVGADTNCYHATVNGHKCWFVRWDGSGVGGGWRDDDLTPA